MPTGQSCCGPGTESKSVHRSRNEASGMIYMKPISTKQQISIKRSAVIEGNQRTRCVDVDIYDPASSVQSRKLKGTLLQSVVQIDTVNQIPVLIEVR